MEKYLNEEEWNELIESITEPFIHRVRIDDDKPSGIVYKNVIYYKDIWKDSLKNKQDL